MTTRSHSLSHNTTIIRLVFGHNNIGDQALKLLSKFVSNQEAYNIRVECT